MREHEFYDLDDGDVVRHAPANQSYMVTGNYGSGGVILTRTILATNAREWDLIAKVERFDVPKREARE